MTRYGTRTPYRVGPRRPIFTSESCGMCKQRSEGREHENMIGRARRGPAYSGIPRSSFSILRRNGERRDTEARRRPRDGAASSRGVENWNTCLPGWSGQGGGPLCL